MSRLSTTIYAIAVGVFLLLAIGNAGLKSNTTYADCKMPGNNHDDNSPSEKKGEKMIEAGASVCEIAKKCDTMSISIDIDSKKELHETVMYQNASNHVQKELDNAMKEGHGHDGLYCYEIEDIFNN